MGAVIPAGMWMKGEQRFPTAELCCQILGISDKYVRSYTFYGYYTASLKLVNDREVLLHFYYEEDRLHE